MPPPGVSSQLYERTAGSETRPLPSRRLTPQTVLIFGGSCSVAGLIYLAVAVNLLPWLAGVADLWTRSPDIEGTLKQVTDEEPVLLFTHNPDIFPEVPPRVSLTLAGHTHGGQMNLPIFGRPVVPSQYGQRYAFGHVVENGRHLYVSGGVGTSIIPARFRVPPEVVVLTLDSAGS